MSLLRTTTATIPTRVNTFNSINSGTILNYIMNNEYTSFVNIINTNNVNYVINTEEGYTALHYAIQFRRYKMIQHLLKLGADTLIKTKDGEDSYDLSLKFQCKEAIAFKLKEKDDIIKDNDKKISELEKKNKVCEDNIKYITSAIDEANIKQSILKKENGELSSTIERLDTTIFNLRTEKEAIECERDKLKRNYTDLEKSYDGLAKRMRK